MEQKRGRYSCAEKHCIEFMGWPGKKVLRFMPRSSILVASICLAGTLMDVSCILKFARL